MNYTKTILVCALLAIVFFLIAPILFSRWRHRDNPQPRVKIEMRNLLGALQIYETEYDKYPSGNPAEILQALLGKNPKMKAFLSISPRSTNGAGQLVDPWGTPYEITFDSTNRITIRSAGRNRIFGDEDDATMSTRRTHQ